MLIKSLSKAILPAILLAMLLLAISTAPAPSRADEPPVDAPVWQMIVHTAGGNCTIPLVTDYSCNGVPCTLADPMIPLRAFAAALDLTLDFRRVQDVAAVLWPADEALILLDELPSAITLAPQAACLPLFEVPRVLAGCFCVPLSFLDVIALDYNIDAANMLVNVYATQSAAQTSITSISSIASMEELWQTAAPQLDILLTPSRHLLSSATLALNPGIDSASLLQAASKLHGTCISPGGQLACCPASTTPDMALHQALHDALYQAGLPQSSGAFANDTLFPLQIACRVAPGSLTIQVYQLNSLAAASAYLGPIAQ